VKRTFTFKLSNMLGTQREDPGLGRGHPILTFEVNERRSLMRLFKWIVEITVTLKMFFRFKWK